MTVAIMNMLRMSVGVANPYQFGQWIANSPSSQNWPDVVDSNKLYKYFRGDVSRHPTRLIGLLEEVFPGTMEKYWCGPDNLWVALWGDIQQISMLIKESAGSPERSTLEAAIEGIFLTNIAHGSVDLSTNIALYRYLNFTDPYGRFGDGFGFGRAFCAYGQIHESILKDETKLHLSELGILEGLISEVSLIEKQRMDVRPGWVSPLECGASHAA